MKEPSWIGLLVERWPHWHYNSKRGWYSCTTDHRGGKREDCGVNQKRERIEIISLEPKVLRRRVT